QRTAEALLYCPTAPLPTVVLSTVVLSTVPLSKRPQRTQLFGLHDGGLANGAFPHGLAGADHLPHQRRETLVGLLLVSLIHAAFATHGRDPRADQVLDVPGTGNGNGQSGLIRFVHRGGPQTVFKVVHGAVR